MAALRGLNFTESLLRARANKRGRRSGSLREQHHQSRRFAKDVAVRRVDRRDDLDTGDYELGNLLFQGQKIDIPHQYPFRSPDHATTAPIGEERARGPWRARATALVEPCLSISVPRTAGFGASRPFRLVLANVPT